MGCAYALVYFLGSRKTSADSDGVETDTVKSVEMDGVTRAKRRLDTLEEHVDNLERWLRKANSLRLYFRPNAGWATMAWMAARREKPFWAIDSKTASTCGRSPRVTSRPWA